jgi:PAS domain S-box-containing protein
VGALSLAGDDPALLREETLSVARAIADQLAVALQHAAQREALEEREARLRAILEGSPNGILVIDDSAVVRYANPAAHRLFGAPDHTLAGAALDALVPRGLAAHPAEVAAWFERGAAPPGHPVDTEACRLDGSTIPVHVLLARVEASGERLAIATVVDLSERAALEARLRQAERLQSLGQFAGILAHDVRNHLTAIAWSADQLAAELAPGDPRLGDVDVIRRATNDAVDMTRSMLELARPADAPAGALDLGAHLAGARAMLQRVLGDAIRLEIDVATDLPPAAITATALTQVVGNLASNARDAMPEGGVFRMAAREVRVGAGASGAASVAERPGRYVRLVATDTGAGMDEATQRRAFEAFFTTKPTPAGTGLGLASVVLLVTRAGGEVHVESEPRRGTTFTIDLPAAG